MKNESQQALLLLRQYLYQQTDEQHPVSVTDILAFWQQHGIQAGRKSVYTDIELLQNAGMVNKEADLKQHTRTVALLL